MNNDLISREALKKALESPCWATWEWKFICECIDNAPTVNTTCPNCDSGYAQGYSDGYLKGKEARPHGKWKDLSDGWQEGTYECSNCKSEFVLTEGTPEDNEYHYCPNCGAKMDLKEAEEC